MTLPELTAPERRALLALEKLTAGEETFLNVIDADALVRKGLAELFGKGQFILTDQGYRLLDTLNGRAKAQEHGNI